MRKTAPKKVVPLSFKLTSMQIEFLDALALELAPPGIAVSRADALRYLITRGIEEKAKRSGG